MVAKNIFEKLGLIESVNEDENEESALEEDFFSDEEVSEELGSQESEELDSVEFESEEFETEELGSDVNEYFLDDIESGMFEEVDEDQVAKEEQIQKMQQEQEKQIQKEQEEQERETQKAKQQEDQADEVSDLENRIAQMKEIDDELANKEEMINEEHEYFVEDDIEDKLDVLIGSYEKNKFLSIEDIYRNARLTLDTKKSIFMVDILSKTLPENLPIDVKRETVLSLMNVSELKRDNLLNDAYQRIDTLNTVLEDTVETSEEIIEKNNKTIEELKRRIEELESINEERLDFQQDQNTLIEYEIQKIINLVDFVKPKK